MDDNPAQPGAPVRIVTTNQDGTLHRVNGEKYIVDLPTGTQVSVSMGEIEFLPVPGKHPPDLDES